MTHLAPPATRYYGDWRTLVWCDTCRAHNAVSRPVLALTSRGVQHICTFIVCPTCSPSDEET